MSTGQSGLKSEAAKTRPTRANTVEVDGVDGADGVETQRIDTLYKKPANNEVRNNFFTLRVTRSWNELPEEGKRAKSV